MIPYDIMERLVDKFGVADTLLMLKDVLSAKAEHISISWQDNTLAGKWDKAASIVGKAVRELPKAPGIK